jgi:hypothetical protein
MDQIDHNLARIRRVVDAHINRDVRAGGLIETPQEPDLHVPSTAPPANSEHRPAIQPVLTTAQGKTTLPARDAVDPPASELFTEEKTARASLPKRVLAWIKRTIPFRGRQDR